MDIFIPRKRSVKGLVLFDLPKEKMQSELLREERLNGFIMMYYRLGVNLVRFN